MALMAQHVTHYFSELGEAVSKLPAQDINQVISILLESAHRRRKVFVCGNGGSASTASHISCDLAKNTMVAGAPRLRVVGLTDNVPMMSAWANDTGYDNVFAAQLIPLVEPGDVLIGISCSGNSPNVLNAVVAARQHGATTIGFTGHLGGQLIDSVDICIQVSHPLIEIQEDVHLALGHCITAALRTELEQEAARTLTKMTLTVPAESIRI
jgi:D-sedoheptulose 7-phosphate isomerase